MLKDLVGIFVMFFLLLPKKRKTLSENNIILGFDLVWTIVMTHAAVEM